MSEKVVLAVGEVLWDLLPSGPRLGGAIANLAVATARLGHASALVSCVGDDVLGSEARSLLAAQSRGTGFDVSLIQTTTSAPTGTVGVELGPGGLPRYVFATPSAWDRIATTSEGLAAAASAGAICYGSLAQRDEPSRTAIRAIVEAATSAVRVFDVNIRAPFASAAVVQWSLQHAELVKISEEELEMVLGMFGGSSSVTTSGTWTIADIENAARVVLAYAPACRLVAVTLGPLGSLLVSREATHRHPGFPTTVEDTVGAGDAFTAGMTHAYLHGSSLAAINEVGNLCGSFVASQPGAMPAYPAGLLERIAAALSM